MRPNVGCRQGVRVGLPAADFGPGFHVAFPSTVPSVGVADPRRHHRGVGDRWRPPRVHGFVRDLADPERTAWPWRRRWWRWCGRGPRPRPPRPASGGGPAGQATGVVLSELSQPASGVAATEPAHQNRKTATARSSSSSVSSAWIPPDRPPHPHDRLPLSITWVSPAAPSPKPSRLRGPSDVSPPKTYTPLSRAYRAGGSASCF